MVLKFSHAVIASVAVNGTVFPDRFPLPTGKFTSADRTGNQGTEYVDVTGRTPRFCLSGFKEHMILLHRHIGFTIRRAILVNPCIFGVMEYFINLVIAGGVFTVFVGDIPRRVTNGKAGKIMLDGVLDDGTGSRIFFDIAIFDDVTVGRTHSGYAHSL